MKTLGFDDARPATTLSVTPAAIGSEFTATRSGKRHVCVDVPGDDRTEF